MSHPQARKALQANAWLARLTIASGVLSKKCCAAGCVALSMMAFSTSKSPALKVPEEIEAVLGMSAAPTCTCTTKYNARKPSVSLAAVAYGQRMSQYAIHPNLVQSTNQCIADLTGCVKQHKLSPKMHQEGKSVCNSMLGRSKGGGCKAGSVREDAISSQVSLAECPPQGLLAARICSRRNFVSGCLVVQVLQVLVVWHTV